MEDLMQMHEMTEADIRSQFIDPALRRAGWDDHAQVRREHDFTDGRVIVNGHQTARGKRKRADYILYYKRNLPLAIVEAKDATHCVGAGMQQALEYAEILDLPFAYSTNGRGFLEHDLKTGAEREIPMDQLPSPDELWRRFTSAEGLTPEQEKIVTEPYYFKQGEKSPRYYQRIAINRTVSAIAQGQKRILLEMATGTGKTYTAFQIIHRLWKSRQREGKKMKVLFLADRNILVDQTRYQDFSPFERVMTKIENRKLDTAYDIYLSLYQQLVGPNGEKYYTDISKSFFDLIVIDECHRGSAKADSAWRDILTYFDSAVHLGMTATPKETREVSNISYFGDPVYSYSLKQGIEDGFLAPYKVIRVGLDVDVMGWRPAKGQRDDNGNEIEDREYGSPDYDKNIILKGRTEMVARRVSRWLRENGRMSKTIVFCTGVNHAERMRQHLANLNRDIGNVKYVMRITGDDPIGKKQLDNFIDVEQKYPVVATTSKLLSTGVDCKTCKLIVLDSNIQSMTEFKQIIGRGTRLLWDDDKRYFTIMDFRNVSRLFADPAFDGDPVVVIDESPTPPDPSVDSVDPLDPPEPPEPPVEPPLPPVPPPPPPYVPVVSDVEAHVLDEVVKFYDVNGKLTVESVKSYRDGIRGVYSSLEVFKAAWNRETQKSVIAETLKEHNILLSNLKDKVGKPDYDEFDLICHLAFDQKPLTKAERINHVKKRGYLSKYQGVAREVLETLLEKYGESGIMDIGDMVTFSNDPFRERFGSEMKIAKAFGGRDGLLKAIKELEDELYKAA